MLSCNQCFRRLQPSSLQPDNGIVANGRWQNAHMTRMYMLRKIPDTGFFESICIHIASVAKDKRIIQLLFSAAVRMGPFSSIQV